MLQNIRWGVRGGLALALLYCAWITAVRVFGGARPFEREGVTYLGVAAAYLAIGLSAGAVVGVLRPMTRHRAGAYVVGLFAGTVLSSAITALVAGPPWRWDFDEWVVLPIVAAGAGALIGRELAKSGGAARV
jgi:hypothetical protein